MGAMIANVIWAVTSLVNPESEWSRYSQAGAEVAKNSPIRPPYSPSVCSGVGILWPACFLPVCTLSSRHEPSTLGIGPTCVGS